MLNEKYVVSIVSAVSEGSKLVNKYNKMVD